MLNIRIMKRGKMFEVEIYSEQLSNQEIHIGHKEQSFAPTIFDSEISESKIYLKEKQNSSIENSQFINCTVEGKKAYQIWLTGGSWIDCEFKGRFSDCVFGNSPGSENRKNENVQSILLQIIKKYNERTI